MTRVLVLLPVAVLEKALQQLDRPRIEPAARILDLLLETTAVQTLNAIVHERGIGKLGRPDNRTVWTSVALRTEASVSFAVPCGYVFPSRAIS